MRYLWAWAVIGSRACGFPFNTETCRDDDFYTFEEFEEIVDPEPSRL